MENMAAAALGLTLLLQLPPLLLLPPPKKHVAAQDALQPQSLGAGGAESGGGDGGEEGAGEKGDGDGGGGGLLLPQMYRHCKPPSFLRWLWHYKETFKMMPSDWSNNWVNLSFGHRKWSLLYCHKQVARLQKTWALSRPLCLHQVKKNGRLLCACA
uniref:Uncharacterized protein n=1 Tax=Sphaerodactylus townsendi TaxID=933632 RepID=A0ACB8ECC1_9SAUR